MLRESCWPNFPKLSGLLLELYVSLDTVCASQLEWNESEDEKKKRNELVGQGVVWIGSPRLEQLRSNCLTEWETRILHGFY